MRRSRSCSASSGSFALVRPRRVAMRKTWVSTAMPSTMPKALLSTMFAVLRPTPGRRVSSSIELGTCPPNSAVTIWAVCTACLALERKNPSGCSTSSTSPRGAQARAAASGQRSKSTGVTRFTAASVVWAESSTAITSENGSWKCRAHSALGYRAAMRAHTSAARSRFFAMDSRGIWFPSRARSDSLSARAQYIARAWGEYAGDSLSRGSAAARGEYASSSPLAQDQGT